VDPLNGGLYSLLAGLSIRIEWVFMSIIYTISTIIVIQFRGFAFIYKDFIPIVFRVIVKKTVVYANRPFMPFSYMYKHMWCNNIRVSAPTKLLFKCSITALTLVMITVY